MPRIAIPVIASAVLLIVIAVMISYFVPQAKESAPVPSTITGTYTTPIRILFGGDMMFDRWIREKAMKRGNGFVFDGVRDELKSHDLTVANLEGPITDQPSVSMTSVIGSHDNYVFSFDPSWAKTLALEGIGPVNLGNNHILNQEEDGVTQTRNYLNEAKVAYFGDPTSEDRILIQDVRGTKIAFVSYDEFASDGKRHTFDDIAKAKASSDIVILYAHWGSEYLPVRDDVRALAHAFIDAGCDAIIGSHPHIAQEKETYAGKTVYYSLGNFIFDQYQRDDTRRGLLVSMTVDPVSKAISFRDVPIELRTDGSTTLSAQ
ncbi:MAG: CapA family protein [Candidatus Moraniibacteriota bacterium]